MSENDSTENVNKSEALSSLFNFLEKYKDRVAIRSKTTRLWIQYVEYITIIKNFIREEITGNWHLYLLSTSQMLNLFAAPGHVNYDKRHRMYLQIMLELLVKCPDLYEKLSTEGYHRVRRSNRF